LRLLIQRVSQARVEVDGEVVGAIGPGLVVFLGIARDDTARDADYLVDKMLGLRIFPDAEYRMNRSVAETGGAVLVVSQFTLYGDVRKGRRPSFDAAAPPDQARALYDYFVEQVRRRHPHLQTGVFQARMAVHLVNDGPVTLLCESRP
jgi:D-tyrosyl-tRNA(Tyr) deacylase